MKRVILAILMMVGILSCATDTREVNTSISGRFVGSAADTIYLERMLDNFSMPETVAVARLEDNGAFRFELNIDEKESPRFYRICTNNGDHPITLVVAPKDNIKLESAGDIFLNYSVEGSEESELIREFNREYFGLCDQIAYSSEHMDAAESYAVDVDLAMKAIQAQLRFVGSHPKSLAAYYAVRHNVIERYFPEFDGRGITILHYRTVLEGLKETYPDSPYIAQLENDIADMERIINLMENIKTISYPDIELEDMYKTKHKLSSLEGKVVLLYFWTLNSALCNSINADLKELYNKYHSDGFEVYHVSADSNKSSWIEMVRQQRLPWISVFGGENMNAFSSYNVIALPTAYLINREGNISVAPLSIPALEQEIKSAL